MNTNPLKEIQEERAIERRLHQQEVGHKGQVLNKHIISQRKPTYFRSLLPKEEKQRLAKVQKINFNKHRKKRMKDMAEWQKKNPEKMAEYKQRTAEKYGFENWNDYKKFKYYEKKGEQSQK